MQVKWLNQSHSINRHLWKPASRTEGIRDAPGSELPREGIRIEVLHPSVDRPVGQDRVTEHCHLFRSSWQLKSEESSISGGQGFVSSPVLTHSVDNTICLLTSLPDAVTVATRTHFRDWRSRSHVSQGVLAPHSYAPWNMMWDELSL